MSAGIRAASIPYRRDIDGLRGIAVLAVIGYHARWPGFAGGYLGVDVFFVISGYLITRLITAHAVAGDFRLGAFFARRFRRLAPALVVLLLFCLVPSWWWMLPTSLMDFGRGLLAVLGLVPNLHFWRSTGYFNAATDEHPLLHTWSLGIEEQFYVGFALLMLMLLARLRRHISACLVLLFVASLVACEVIRRDNELAAFYLLPFRAWELLLGALTARVAERLNGRLAVSHESPWQTAAALLGVIGLLSCITQFDKSISHPGLWTLLPTALSAIVILGGAGPRPAAGILSWTPLVSIGLVSYSAYLWHYPLFVFTELALLRMPTALESIGLVALTFAAAALSWRFVEQPARHSRQPFAFVVGWVAAGALGVASFAGWALASQGAPQRLPDTARWLLQVGGSRNTLQPDCLSRIDNPRPPSEACRLGDARSTPTLVLMGDSHADALVVALDERLRARGLAGLVMAHNGCAPTPTLRRANMIGKSPCESYFSAALAWLAAHPEVSEVVLVARWSAYSSDVRFDNGEGGVENGPELRLEALVPPRLGSEKSAQSTRAQRVLAGYRDGIQALRAMGRRVVLVDPIPEVGRHVPHWLALQNMRGIEATSDFTTPFVAYQQRQAAVLAMFDSLPTSGHGGALTRIYTAALFCDTSLQGRCTAQQEGVPLYYDDNHLNREGAERVAVAIDAVLSRADLPLPPTRDQRP